MPQCGGKPCNFPDLPLLGYHACALCRCDLHGPCGIFFSEQSIKFQNVCHPCHRKAFKVLGTDTPGHSPVGVAGAKDASDEDSSVSTDEASSEEQELGQSTDDCKVRATAEAAALKQAEKLAIKSFDFKAVTWEDVTVGEVPSTNKQDRGMMVKSVLAIGGYRPENFTAKQIRLVCATLKLSGYRSKSKEETLRIMAVSKLHAASYDAMGNRSNKEAAKAPAKTKNCIFRLINVLFSDEISAKFISLGEKNSKNVLDSGLAGFDEYFWQDVSVQYQSTCSAFDDLAFYDDMFEGINPSVKLNHSWSKLREIYKVLSKDYEVVRENHKKSGNHDDFINFCNNKSEVYYLYLWLQQKPDVTNVVAYELPENVFCDSTANLIIRRPSPTNSYTTRQSLVESVNALVEARKPNAKQLQLTEEKLKSQVSKNRDDAMGRLFIAH